VSKTGAADFGTIWIRYAPTSNCLKTEVSEEYINEYRNLGIFQGKRREPVCRIGKATKPVWARCVGSSIPAAAWPPLVERAGRKRNNLGASSPH